MQRKKTNLMGALLLSNVVKRVPSVEKKVINTATNAKSEEIEFPSNHDNDKQIVLQHEINMELASHLLQNVISEKRRKYAVLVQLNTALSNKIQKIEEVNICFCYSLGNCYSNGTTKENN